MANKEIIDQTQVAPSAGWFTIVSNGSKQAAKVDMGDLVPVARLVFASITDPAYGASTGGSEAANAAAIQAAINSGLPVWIPVGTFLCAPITVPDDCTIQGAGRGKSILKFSVTGTDPAIRSTIGKVTYTYRFKLADISIRGTDGNGGIGIWMNTFRDCDFRNVDVRLFRNAGDTGIGLYLNNDYGNCAENHFFNLYLADSDTLLKLDTTSATFATGYNTFHGVTMAQEKTCVDISRTAGLVGPSYNSFFGLFVQGAASGINDDYLKIDGNNNVFMGVVFDGATGSVRNAAGPGWDINFASTRASGNTIQIIGGYAVARVHNLATVGAANDIQAPAERSHTPGKAFSVTEITGDLQAKWNASGATNGLEIDWGNGTSSLQWRWIMNASATPALQLQNISAVSQRWFNGGGASIPKSLVVETTASASIAVASAVLELRSTTQGFLNARMTTVQGAAIASKVEGLGFWDTTTHLPSWWDGTTMISPATSPQNAGTLIGATLAANVLSSSLTHVGTLDGLTVAAANLDARLQSLGATDSVSLAFGNATASLLWRLKMQASATPYMEILSGTNSVWRLYPTLDAEFNGSGVFGSASAGVANAKSILELKSGGTKGFLNARMTTAQITTFAGTLGAGEAGMEFFDTTVNKKKFWNGSAVETVTSA